MSTSLYIMYISMYMSIGVQTYVHYIYIYTHLFITYTHFHIYTPVYTYVHIHTIYVCLEPLDYEGIEALAPKPEELRALLDMAVVDSEVALAGPQPLPKVALCMLSTSTTIFFVGYL